MYELNGARELQADARLAWAAVADPVAYFSWSPAGVLVAAPDVLKPVMRLEITSPVLGRAQFEHRIDAAATQVVHKLALKVGLLNLGAETHTWTLRPKQGGGCLASQTMRIEQPTLASHLAAGYLKGELRKTLELNFDRLGAWLRDNPSLSTARVDAMATA